MRTLQTRCSAAAAAVAAGFAAGVAAGTAAAEALLDTVFPEHCVGCGAPASGPIPVCNPCRTALRPIDGVRCRVCGVPLVSETGLCLRCRAREIHYDRHRSVFVYSGIAKQIIVSYKFGGRLRFSGLLSDYIVPFIPPTAVVVPVPASPSGRRRRGYDQVRRLAEELARRHGVPVVRALARGRGKEQKRLDFEGRSRNLAGAVRLRPAFGLRRAAVPPHVVLLDDVFTTGATVNECARVLRGAGAGRIEAVTLAAD